MMRRPKDRKKFKGKQRKYFSPKYYTFSFLLCGGSGGKVGWSTIVQTIFVRNEDNGFENVLLQMTVLITDWGGCKN